MSTDRRKMVAGWIDPIGWSVVLLAILAVVCPCPALSIAADDTATRAAATNDAERAAFRVGELWTGDGQRIADAVLLVADGKIIAVGSVDTTPIPTGFVLHDRRGMTMIPGLILAESGLAEGGEDDELAVTPAVRAVDGFDFFAPRQELLAAGVTTVQISPGAARLVPGQGSVVKLAGESIETRVLRSSESLRVLLTDAAFSPPTVYEPPVGAVSEVRPLLPTQPQLASNLSGAVSGLEALLQAARELDVDATLGTAANDVALETLADILRQGQTVRLTARSAAELQAAMDLAARFQLPAMFVQPRTTAALEALDWQVESWRGVILSPGVRPGRLEGVWGLAAEDEEPRRQTAWEMAAALVSAGAGDKLALRLESDEDIPHVRYLAALLQQGGLSAEQVLSILTANPARLLGVADRVGRLAVGLDADFVLLNGGPLLAATRVEATYVDGQAVYEAQASAETRVVSAGAVFANGQMVPQGRVAVSGGKITSVGAQVSAPLSAAHDHFPGAVIVPGMIDLGTVVGWGAPVSERLPLQTKMGDYLAMDDEAIAAARRGGITTGLLSSSSLPSPVVAFKLSDRPRVIRDPVALRFEVRGNLTQVESSLRRTLQAGKAYHESWVKHEAAMADYQVQLKAYEAELAKYEAEKKAKEAAAAGGEAKPAGEAADKPAGEKPAGDKPAGDAKPVDGGTTDAKPVEAKPVDGKPVDAKPADGTPAEAKPAEGAAAEDPAAPKKPTAPQPPRAQEALEPYRALFGGKIPAIVEAGDALSIRLALKLFRQEFALQTILAGGPGLEQVASEVATSGAKFIVGPELFGRVDGQSINYPQVLAQQQVPFGFQTKSGAASGLAYAIGFAVHQGLADHEALSAVTVGAAELFGLESTGRLAPGHEADLVVLSGPPFDPASQVLAVMIDGQWVYRRGAKP